MLEEQEYKLKQLGKGQQVLIQSRKKWKRRYYKMKDKNKNLQNKIIDLMAEDIDSYQIECNRYFKDKEEVKQYFENKAK